MSGLDYNSICRLCLQFFEGEKASPIFHNEAYNDKVSLSERIRYCSAIEVVEGDGLPPQICNNCLSKLNQSFVFRNQCVLADITLKRLRDIDLSMNEIPNVLKIDIENQIIHSEKNDIYNSVDADKLKNKIKSIDKIDEFDNSKNGRHKRCIHKLKCKPLNITKILNSKTEGFQIYTASKGMEINFKKSQIMNSKRIKGEITNNSEIEVPNNETLTGGKKCRKLKRQFEQLKPEKNDFQKETVIEISTDEPKLSNIGDNRESSSSNPNTGEFPNGCCKDVLKPKFVTSKLRKKIKIPYRKEKPTSYKCDHCQKVYPSEGGWRYHIHTMHNENYQPFICDLCGQAFKVKKNLQAHKNSVHFHLKLHLCDLCGRGFASKYALKVHKIWHNDEKNFSCDVCGTKFRTRGKMNTHRSIHGGPKNFMCHICSRDFRWKKDFEIHMRTHTGEKPFKCSHCGKAFASLTNMKKHEKNHLKKAETDEITEKLDVAVTSADGKPGKNEFLAFYNGLNDMRNIQISQFSETRN